MLFAELCFCIAFHFINVVINFSEQLILTQTATFVYLLLVLIELFDNNADFVFSFLLECCLVLDMVLPIMHSTSSDNMPIMLGCLHCIRLIIPQLDHEKIRTAIAMDGTEIQHAVKLDTTVMVRVVLSCIHFISVPPVTS